jgi:Chaperone of endosialidase
MKTPIKFKTAIATIVTCTDRYSSPKLLYRFRRAKHCGQVVFALGSFALLPLAQAVVPTPDGGYPGGNTAEGQAALLSLTTGMYNTAVGAFSLRSDTTGKFCTGVGAGTLLVNTADNNTATGAGALLSNTSGSFNTAYGAFALFHNTTGGSHTAVGYNALGATNASDFLEANTAVGDSALANDTDGNANAALGYAALVDNTTGNSNTAIGNLALAGNNTGNSNTATGAEALLGNTTGNNNTATGYQALLSNTGDFNTANGFQALISNTTGGFNTALGDSALFGNTSGSGNTAIGTGTLVNNSTSDGNTAIGQNALSGNNGNTIGGDNTAIGFNALTGISLNNIGGGNIALGAGAGQNITGDNNIAIGNIGGLGESNTIRIGGASHTSTYIAGIWTQLVRPDGLTVVIDTDGKLGTFFSSRRFKRDIKPMATASEAILALKPVTFRYKSDAKNTPCFGLIAEEVAEVEPALVVRDKNGEVLSVRYDQVNAMLLNEFLKEHKKVEMQQATIAELELRVSRQEKSFRSKLAEQERQIAALTSGLQKVSAQIELTKTRSQIVINDSR